MRHIEVRKVGVASINREIAAAIGREVVHTRAGVMEEVVRRNRLGA